MKSNEAIETFRTEGTTWPSATRAGQLIFAGSHTPHDPSSGRLVLSTGDLGADQASLRAAVLFTEIVSGRLRAQTWQVLQNLKATLERAGSSIEHAVHLRIFLKDIAHEGTVLDLVKKFFAASLCSAEIVEARNEGSHPSLLVHMDCIALAADAGRPKHVWAKGFERLTDPFPTATLAAGFLFSSQMGGVNPNTGAVVEHENALTARARQLLGALGERSSRQSLAFFLQQAAMWDHLLSVLDAFGVEHKSTLYHMNWMRRPMSVFSDGSVTRGIQDRTGDYLLTCFPASAVRTPAAELEGRIVAILPDSGFKKDVRVPIHGISNSYFGAIKAGPYLFAAGEVPVDTAKWEIVDRSEQLPAPGNLMAVGKPYEVAPIQVQSHYIYELYKETYAAYGIDLSKALHQTIYLTDASDGPRIESIIARHFGDRPPATTIVPILAASPFEATRLELELTAYIGAG